MKKRILSLRFILLMMLLFGMMLDSSAYDFESNGIYYKITSTSNMTVAVTYYSQTNNRYSGSVAIPATTSHNGKTYTVTAIGNYAFVGCTSLTSVSIPSPNLTTIGDRAFSGCNGMSSMVFPDCIKSVGNYAFAGCFSISQVTFNATTATISLGNGTSEGSSHGLFEDCPLTKVVINRPLSYNTSSTYGYSPFANQASLSSITFGENVTTIPGNVFYGNTCITSYTVPSHITALSDYAFNGFKGAKTITLPEGIKAISKYAFSGCTNLTSISLPTTVTTIGEYAFSNSGLTNLIIKPAVISIGNYAFNGCTALAHLTIDESEEALSLGYNYLNSNSEALGKGLFYDCPLSGAFIGRPLSYKTAKSYGYSPLAYVATLVKAHFGNPLKAIPDYLLANCTALKTLQYNSQCQPTAIGKYAFWGCTALTSSDIHYPTSVKTIGEGAFSKCTSLLGYTIPDHVTTVGDYAFSNCDKLANLVIKPSVTSIGNGVFNGCTALAHLTIEESEVALSMGCNYHNSNSDALGKGLFYDCPLSGAFIGRPLSYNTAKSYGYSPFAYNATLEKAHFGNPVTAIQDYLLANCTSLTILQYNSQCHPTAIGKYAFWGCTALTTSDIHYPTSVKTIDEGAFSKCTSLVEFSIPNHVTTVGNYAFLNCEKLERLIIEESNETLSLGYNYYNSNSSALGKGLFYGCPLVIVYIKRPLNYHTAINYGYSPFANIETLQVAHFDGALEYIQDYLFYGCKALHSVNYSSDCTPTAIGKYTFWGCASLHAAAIHYPTSVKTIGEGAFGKCTLLEYYTIPDHVTTIGDYAFKDCDHLAVVYIMPSVTSIGNGAFNGCTALEQLRIEDGENTLSLGYNYHNSSSSALGKGLFYDCPLHGAFIGRPLSYNSAISYGYSPFANNTTLEKVRLGNSVTNVHPFLFYGCTSFTNLYFDDDCLLTSISKYAFSGCKKIVDVDDLLVESLKTIGEGAFLNCTGIERITIPASVTTIENYAFNGCTAISELELQDSEQTISLGYNYKNSSSSGLGKGLFYDCLLTTVFIGRPFSYSGSAQYGYSPFANNASIASVRLGKNARSVWEYEFYGCTSLTDIELDDDCTLNEIRKYAFSGCKSITNGDNIIPESVKTIGEGAFQNCLKMESVTIPSTITTIGKNGFAGCTLLMDVTCYAMTPPVITTDCFSTDTYSNATLNVVKKTVDAYKKAIGWKEFSKIVGSIIVDEPGDVNGDGNVNITDINLLIDYILRNKINSETLQSGDVNGDGTINIADINVVIQIILGGSGAKMS